MPIFTILFLLCAKVASLIDSKPTYTYSQPAFSSAYQFFIIGKTDRPGRPRAYYQRKLHHLFQDIDRFFFDLWWNCHREKNNCLVFYLFNDILHCDKRLSAEHYYHTAKSQLCGQPWWHYRSYAHFRLAINQTEIWEYEPIRFCAVAIRADGVLSIPFQYTPRHLSCRVSIAFQYSINQFGERPLDSPIQTYFYWAASSTIKVGWDPPIITVFPISCIFAIS